jgi:hypothetical protein
MYCPNCGNQLNSDLIYCNQCGKRLSAASDETNNVATTLSQVLGALAVFGIIGFVFVMWILVYNGVTQSPLVGVTFFYFAGLFSISFLLMRQVSALLKKPPATTKAAPPDEQQPGYLKPVTTAQLPVPGELPISVTEHTTRTLSRVPVERN